MERALARLILIIYHPLLITSLGIVLLFHSDFYLAFIAYEVKLVVLLSAFLGTCVIPALIVSSRYFFAKVDQMNEKLYHSLVYLITAICYYMAYYVISDFAVAGFFRALFLAGSLLLVTLALISLRWNISVYTAGAGALTGTALALSIRLGIVHSTGLTMVILMAGLTGFSCLRLGKNNPAQVYAGYLVGFSLLFLIFNFIR